LRRDRYLHNTQQTEHTNVPARDGIRTRYPNNQGALGRMAIGIGNEIYLNKFYFIFKPAPSYILILTSVRFLRFADMPMDETDLTCY